MKNFVLLLLASWSLQSASQNAIQYVYDLNGNRISRYWVGYVKTGKDSTIISPAVDTLLKGTTPEPEILEKAWLLSVFPNPTQDRIYIQTDRSNELKHMISGQLFDGQGRVLKTMQINTSLASLDLSELTAGTYYLRLNLSSNETISYRVVKAN